jgi:hypothetical protein
MVGTVCLDSLSEASQYSTLYVQLALERMPYQLLDPGGRSSTVGTTGAKEARRPLGKGADVSIDSLNKSYL